MIRLKEAVIVEGKYDKIRLSSLIDALIIPTGGFSIFQDKDKRNWIRKLAKEKGIVILTDSDRAGREIRNYIQSIVGKEGTVYHAYIPEIFGKEKRKTKPSKEGTIGVEGTSDEIILKALNAAGITQDRSNSVSAGLTKADLMEVGLVGLGESAQKRRVLLEKLSLPKNLSANAMLKAINSSLSKEEFYDLCSRLEDD